MKTKTWLSLFIFSYGLFLSTMGGIAAEKYLTANNSFLALSLAAVFLVTGTTLMALAVLPTPKE